MVSLVFSSSSVCFFFQAEDGIRDGHVTGVQTCALPIFEECPVVGRVESYEFSTRRPGSIFCAQRFDKSPRTQELRSEERRVGKECRSRGWRLHYNKRTHRAGEVTGTVERAAPGRYMDLS